MQRFYSTKQLAELLSVSAEAIEKWRREGKLRPLKAGSLCRYPESEIRRFLGITEDSEPFATRH